MIDVLEAKQFEATLGEDLEIPAEYKTGYKYRFAMQFKDGVLSGRCGEWEMKEGLFTLRHVLIDTSQRHNGFVLVAKRTYYPEFYMAFAPVTIMPLADDRPEGEE